MGGEEFGVVLPDTDGPTAERILNALREDFAKIRHAGSEGEFCVSFSCGIMSRTGDEDSGSVLINKADVALYAAKQAGRNRVVRRAATADDKEL